MTDEVQVDYTKRKYLAPIYSYLERYYNEPIGPNDVEFMVNWRDLPPLLDWDGPKHSRKRAFKPRMFNDYSANWNAVSPAYYDQLITIPQQYDEYDYYRPRANPKSGYYAKKFTHNTATENDEYVAQPKNEISQVCEKMGSNLSQLLAAYGVRGLLAGGLVGGAMYGGYKAYNWWKNRKPQVEVEAGVNVTSKELSNNTEASKPTNFTLNPADAETRAKIRRLIKY